MNPEPLELPPSGPASASQPQNHTMTARNRMTSRISLASGDVITVDSPTWLTSKELARISGWLRLIFCIEDEPDPTSYLGAALAGQFPIRLKPLAPRIRLSDTL